MIWDILNIHKSHQPKALGFYMFHDFNILKQISISVLFFSISVSSFWGFLLDF